MPVHKARCPICDASLTLTNLEVSEIISCGECRSRLVVQVIQASGVQLAEAPAVEEDWGE